MLHEECNRLDPRVRRTRELLQGALRKLLDQKRFDDITVQDITEAATLNRATFYAHYPDILFLPSATTWRKSKNLNLPTTCSSSRSSKLQ